MLTGFTLGWILAESLPFEKIKWFTLQEFGGIKFYPSIALGIVAHNCECNND